MSQHGAVDPRLVDPTGRTDDGEPDSLEEGLALCLSGGGYRAMLFHVGALWRLDEMGYLPRLDRVSSVSGGSITAAVLALGWDRLDFSDFGRASNFGEVVVDPVRGLAERTLDRGAILRGSLLPGTISERIRAAYREHLFGDATLQDLPDEPRFVINATNVQSGALWRFSKPYMGDWRVGRIMNPDLSVADAVAASSAFPPVLSPAELDLDPRAFEDEGTLTDPVYRREVVLTDGGVYDNLGLETAFKRYRTLLVSDGGGEMDAEADPERDWVRHAKRVLEVVDNQVRSLRKRQLIHAFRTGRRTGTFWSIRTPIHRYDAPGSLEAPLERTRELARTPTRLKALEARRQERLINWGYAVTDAAVRTWMEPGHEPPPGFPYPASGV